MKALIFSAFLASCAAAPVAAQELPCAPRERALAFVLDDLGVSLLATGNAAQGAQVEIYANMEGDWIILLNLTNGQSCLMAGGDNFASDVLQPPRGNPT